jgi:demethylmenaquinone methyltransferase/2-methoxy-6-polyprenyl-1,4-benzoquinol methylase
MVSHENDVSAREHSRRVRAMFGKIAGRYDLLNHLLSGYTDTRWRKHVVRKLGQELSKDGARALDVACGTGDLALRLATSTTAFVIGTDFCRPMLEIAARKSESSEAGTIPFVEADALNLPFIDSSFDAVTIAFGLRNLSNVESGLKELLRVLRPGGRAAILEFSTPVVAGFRSLFKFYFSTVLPRVGGFISGSRAAYEYLPDSVSRFPDQKRLTAMMKAAGFGEVEYQNLTGGVAAIHVGTRIS